MRGSRELWEGTGLWGTAAPTVACALQGVSLLEGGLGDSSATTCEAAEMTGTVAERFRRQVL